MKSVRVILTLVCISLIVLLLTERVDAAVGVEDASAIWLLDENIGKTVKDYSGNGNDGDINGPKWVEGKFGKGLEFSTSQSVKSSTAKGVGKTYISETLWVNFNDFATEQQFGYISCSGTANARFFYFSSWNSAGAPHNCIHLGTIDGAGAWGRGISTGKLFDKNKWYHVASVINNEDGMTRAYVDGKLAHEQKFATGDTPGTPMAIWIGGTPEAYQWVTGTMDEVAFFHVALTEDDINMIMKNGLMKWVIKAVDSHGKLATTWGGIKKVD
jgi:hypothetical protein